jgi:anti-anti-sigma factor
MSNNVIRMPQRFDYSSGPEFNQSLDTIAEQNREVLLDCSLLDYIDSAGIGILVMANKKSQSKNAKLIIINLNKAPREILQLANLQKLIEIR